jgi:hypothetical protein
MPTDDRMTATCLYLEEELDELAKSPSTGKATVEILEELRNKWPVA